MLAVAYKQYNQLGAGCICTLSRIHHVLYDLKHLLAPNALDLRP